MQAISLWLAAAIVILTGWAIVKKYQVNMVLFIAGLLLNIIGVMNGATNFLPKNATATGLLGFDFFELFRAICRTQIAGVGFIILVSGGFAQYMKDVGASDRFVTVCAKPGSSMYAVHRAEERFLHSGCWPEPCLRSRGLPDYLNSCWTG